MKPGKPAQQSPGVFGKGSEGVGLPLTLPLGPWVEAHPLLLPFGQESIAVMQHPLVPESDKCGFTSQDCHVPAVCSRASDFWL